MLVASTLPLLASAQDAAATEKAANPDFWQDAFGSLTIFGGAIVMVGALIAIVRLFNIIMKMEEIRLLREKGVEEVVEAYRQPEQSWWSKFLKSATKAVPVAQEQDIDLGHDYDGIRELDNKLPPWWLWLFYVSIIFSVIYWGVLHVSGSMPTIHQAYDHNMEVAKAEVDAYLATKADKVDENTVTALTDDAALSIGKSIFDTNCATCHGKAGEGLAGPNLTDEYWLHGGGVKEIFKTIKYGVAGKAMIAWQDQIRSGDMQKVASYILTLKGTNPPNAKGPEGTVWTGDAAAAATQDSTAVDTTKAAAPTDTAKAATQAVPNK